MESKTTSVVKESVHSGVYVTVSHNEQTATDEVTISLDRGGHITLTVEEFNNLLVNGPPAIEFYLGLSNQVAITVDEVYEIAFPVEPIEEVLEEAPLG